LGRNNMALVVFTFGRLLTVPTPNQDSRAEKNENLIRGSITLRVCDAT
jgi:hypothetical protein